MRKRLCVGLIVLLMVLGMAATHPAPVFAHTGTWQVSSTAGNGLRVRTGPSGDYHILEVMPAGRLVKARGHRGNWMYLTDLVTGVTGWSSLTYLVAYSAPASGGGGGSSGVALCWDTTFNWTACAPQWIANEIVAAADYYGVPRWAMMQIAACESAFDPNAWAYSPPDNVYGLYQFRPSTMAWVYPGGNVWSVHDSAWAAARLLTIAPAQFDCAHRIGYA